MKKLLIAFAMTIFSACAFAESEQVEVPAGSEKNEDTFVWVRLHNSWWTNYWNEPCSKNKPNNVDGLITTISFKYRDKSFDDSMEELITVVTQQKAAGFKVMPMLNLLIDNGYEKGTEFQAWFDRDVWVERAKWFEAMVPYAYEKNLVIDFEPYWESSDGNPRYPSTEDKKN